MKTLLSRIRSHPWLSLGIGIHALFYVSALGPGWLNVFFSDDSIHLPYKMIDFAQIPRAAFNWWHGGSLTGAAMRSGLLWLHHQHYYINPNVYHPLFTIVVGTVLSLFSPDVAFAFWICVKLALDVLVIGSFWRTVRGRPYAEFATFVLLVSMSEYAELMDGQFQFVLNASLLVLLLALEKRHVWQSALAYTVALLVKPIGLLFVPALFCKRHWQVALLALCAFVLVTWPFLLNGSGRYYIDNLAQNILHPSVPGPDQIMTLNALLHHTVGWPSWLYQAMQYTALAGVTLLGMWRRTQMSKAVFFAVVYFLLFYNLVYEYHWSLLAYVLPVCVVSCPEFQSKSARICILLTCLPTCYLLLRLAHIDILYGRFGWHPGLVAWRWMALSKVVPVLALCVSVLAGDVKFWAKWVCARTQKLGR